MIEIKEKFDEENNLVSHWSEDENGDKYYIKQEETGIEYEEAIDIYPCPYTYRATNKPVKQEQEENF